MHSLGTRFLGGGSSQNLESFLSEGIQCPPDGWKAFTTQWKYRDVCKFLPKYRASLDQVLGNTIDFRRHSLLASYLIGFKGTLNMEDQQEVINFIKQFEKLVNEGDKTQISLCPRPFSDALRTYCSYMKADGRFLNIIPNLKKSIQLLQHQKRHELTLAHCELVFCAVQGSCYRAAFPEIEQDLIKVQGSGSILPYENLLYHYYSGLVFIGFKMFTKALESLTMCFAAPTEVASAIQVEAYKKYILASLIRYNKLIGLPRYTSQMLSRVFPKLCAPYLELSDNFARSTSDAISATITNNIDTFNEDKNFGLVKQVLTAYKKQSVRKLTSVYTRLAMGRVCELCNFDSEGETRMLLIEMISNDELAATIDAEGVVTFAESVTQSDVATLNEVQQRIQKVLDLYSALDITATEIKTSTNYVKKKMASDGPSAAEEAAIAESMMGGYR